MPRSLSRWIKNLTLLGVACVLSGCTGLPKTDGRAAANAITGGAPSRLHQAVQPFLNAHPRDSGLHALPSGPDALTARLALAGLAERSLDVQYYIWHSDQSGKRLIRELFRAADRGVRVRVLLDDLGASPSDNGLLALDSHANIEVRLFNPVTTRSARLLGALLDFGRVNRRMHNKSFIADNQVTIVGGRNIGDEYFGAHGEVNFGDLDVLAVGPVVRDVSHSFDLYWNSPSSISITALTKKNLTSGQIAAQRAVIDATKDTLPLRDNAFAAQLGRGLVPFLPGRTWAVYDAPTKITTPEEDTTTHLAPQLRSIFERTKNELFIVSPYFVPGKRGAAVLSNLRRSGVRVAIFTNSLASTDVSAVHAGYQRYRKPLLRAGVELYENKPVGGWGGSPGGLRGSSRASLHAKTFTFDRRTIFVGSMNLDPRSVRLNTEIGVLVENPQLAASLAQHLQRDLHHNAYRVELVGDRLAWVTTEGGKSVRFNSEPQTSAWQRFKINLLSWLPIEAQL